MLIQVLVESSSNINVELGMTTTKTSNKKNWSDSRSITTYKWDTPLHCAVRYENFDVVKILLEYHHPKSFHVENALNIAKNNLESFPFTDDRFPLTENNDRKIRLQNIVDHIKGWRRQKIHLYLWNCWRIQSYQIVKKTSASSSLLKILKTKHRIHLLFNLFMIMLSCEKTHTIDINILHLFPYLSSKVMYINIYI